MSRRAPPSEATAEPPVNEELASAERLFELVVAGLQSHQRLLRVEAEFEERLRSYWFHVQANIDHGIDLARLEWVRDVRKDERDKVHLDRENDSLDRKNRRLLSRLEKANAQIAGLKAANHGLRHKAKARR